MLASCPSILLDALGAPDFTNKVNLLVNSGEDLDANIPLAPTKTVNITDNANL